MLAKASLLIKKLLFILVITPSIIVLGQSREASTNTQQSLLANQIYKELDTYLLAPDVKATASFSNWLSSKNPTTNDAFLAKVIGLSQLGYHSRQLGNLTKAIDFYTQAWFIYREHGLSGFDILESCLKPLGNLYTQTNAYTEAIEIHQRYLSLAQQAKNNAAVAGGISNLANVYQHFGNPEKAIQILRDGVMQYPKNTFLLTNLASSLVAAQRIEEGLTVAAASIAIDPNQPSVYSLQAQVLAQIGAYDQAYDTLAYALSIETAQPIVDTRAQAKLHLAMANIRFRQEQTKAALSQIEAAYQKLIPAMNVDQRAKGTPPPRPLLYAENTLMDALDLHARIFERGNRENDALILYEHATTVSRLLSNNLSSQQSKMGLQTAQKKRAEAFLELAYSIYQSQPSPELLNRAFAMSQSTQALLATQGYIDKEKRQRLQDEPLVSTLNALEKKQTQWYTELQQKRSALETETPPYLALLDSIESNRFIITATQQALAKRYPDEQKDTLWELEKVKAKTALQQHRVLSYFLGKNTSFQFVIDANETQFVKLTSSAQANTKFLKSITQFLDYFTDANTINRDPQKYANAAFALFQNLHIPLDKSLVILPDSFLQFVPFDALLTSAHKGFQFDQMPWLSNRTDISFALSAQLYLTHDNPMPSTATALGVFPVFEGSNRALPYSLQEAASLEKQFPSVLLLKEEASVVAAFAKADTHQIIHLSTHASGGSFTEPPAISFYDSILPVTQLYGNVWQPDLVVLSACETGIGRIVTGEGAQSLARAFQYSGSKNIVFSLWQVNDQATTQLMSSFYKTLKQNNSRNKSLSLAKRMYLKDKSVSNAKKSPYYWAAFVYYGTVDPVVSKNFWLWGLALGLLIVFLGLLIVRKYGITSRIFARQRLH